MSFKKQRPSQIGMALGGGGGIRTPGPLAWTPVFKTGAINQALPPLLCSFLSANNFVSAIKKASFIKRAQR